MERPTYAIERGTDTRPVRDLPPPIGRAHRLQKAAVGFRATKRPGGKRPRARRSLPILRVPIADIDPSIRSGTFAATNATEGLRDRMGALAVVFAAVPATIFGLYSWFHPLPPIGRGYADGVYRNAECGSIKLRGGVATFNGSSVPYSLERGKNDVVALPPHFLGVRMSNGGCKVTYDESKFPLYLSLGSAAPPKAITLWDVERNLTYAFERDKGG